MSWFSYDLHFGLVWFGFLFLCVHSCLGLSQKIPFEIQTFPGKFALCRCNAEKVMNDRKQGFCWKLFDSFNYSCHYHPSYEIWSSTVTRAGTADIVIKAYMHLYPISHKISIMEHYPASFARHSTLKPQHQMKKSECSQKIQPPNWTTPLQSV